jgi:hypothetical protein
MACKHAAISRWQVYALRKADAVFAAAMAEAVELFPQTVYRFYSQAEVGMLLQTAGFSEVVLTASAWHRMFVIASASRA